MEGPVPLLSGRVPERVPCLLSESSMQLSRLGRYYWGNWLRHDWLARDRYPMENIGFFSIILGWCLLLFAEISCRDPDTNAVAHHAVSTR